MPAVKPNSQSVDAHEEWSIDWSKRLAKIGVADTDIITEYWVIEARNGSTPADLVKTHEDRQGAVHRIWLTSTVGNAAYDVTSWIELPAPDVSAPNIKLDSTFTVRIDP